MKNRIDYLDGLRGIAILMVIGFHAYSRWVDLVPYGESYDSFPLFKLGWLGVQLFFLISGFVIFMTLDKTDNFLLFIYKRWLRLFPAMLIASILIYLTAPMLSERPGGSPPAINLLPGLTFIDPGSWEKLLGVKIGSLEGAFWSLYVEFKFYVLSGIVYYFIGRKYLVPILFSLFIFSLLVTYFSESSGVYLLASLPGNDFIKAFSHFGWFTAGAMFYLYHKGKNDAWFYAAIGVAVFSAIFVRDLRIFPAIAAMLVAGLFASSLKAVLVQRLLQSWVFVFFGAISYPLYLIHENAMIALIIKSPGYIPWLNAFFYPFLPVIILSIIAFIIAKKCESEARKFIDDVVRLTIYKTTRLLSR